MASSGSSLRIQVILYDTLFSAMTRSLDALDNALLHAKEAGVISRASLHYGDCSGKMALDDAAVDRLRETSKHLDELTYTFFNANVGHGGGHNRLLAAAVEQERWLLILNPDSVAAPDMVIQMLAGLELEGVGVVDARQIPIEHPKFHDPETGITSWASGACLLTSLTLMQQLQGFDCKSFFLYCDDVDLSWRARLLGKKIIHRHAATVFHDKRLSAKGEICVTDAERYYWAESALILPHKFSRHDIVKRNYRRLRASADPLHLAAVKEFERRRRENTLPDAIDAAHEVAEFIEDHYGRHRF